MASFEKALSKDIFNSLLPTFGTPKKPTPVWDREQKMFLINNYETVSGNYTYEGIRFCENVVIKEKVGQYHTWTYLNTIEIYAFNGTKLELVQKKDFEKVHRQSVNIPQECENMIFNYLSSGIKLQGLNASKEHVRNEAKRLTEGCFKDFLDEDYNPRLMKMLPLLESY